MSVINNNGSFVNELCPSVRCNNSSFGELLLSLFGYWFSERSLEAHQIRPVYLDLIWIGDTLIFHSSIPIYYLGCTYKYLLGIAPTKSTSTDKRPRVNYCNPTSCKATFPSYCRSCNSSPNYYNIKRCCKHYHQYSIISNNFN